MWPSCGSLIPDPICYAGLKAGTGKNRAALHRMLINRRQRLIRNRLTADSFIANLSTSQYALTEFRLGQAEADTGSAMMERLII